MADMAWRCSGKTNAELIDNLLKARIITSERVGQAMKATDRALYVPSALRSSAYEDAPQPIGHGATISAPHMHAHALENLLPFLKPGARVLDVGSGSGYLISVFSHLVSPNGYVLGLEHIPDLVEQSRQSLLADPVTKGRLEKGEIEVKEGDGRVSQGHEGIWDAIHVGAAAREVPNELLRGLKSPGRMFIPVGTFMQEIYQVDKDENGNITKKPLMGVQYVPLTDKDAQLKGAF